MWRNAAALLGEESHVKKEKRERGGREWGFRLIRVMMCWGFRDGRRRLSEVWRGFDGEFWMA